MGEEGAAGWNDAVNKNEAPAQPPMKLVQLVGMLGDAPGLQSRSPTGSGQSWGRARPDRAAVSWGAGGCDEPMEADGD